MYAAAFAHFYGFFKRMPKSTYHSPFTDFFIKSARHYKPKHLYGNIWVDKTDFSENVTPSMYKYGRR